MKNKRLGGGCMKIELHLYASLAKYLPPDAVSRTCYVDLDAGGDVGGIVRKMEIPAKAVKLIFVNGVRADDTTPLKDGDRIGLFPPVGGG